MNIWTILGIDNTKDKEIIKKAYREKLTGVNPEDNPEGFMQLRKAYEEAIREADRMDEDHDIPEYEEGSLLYELRKLYDDFSRRILPEEWEEIFNRDEFVALDQAEDSKHTLLTFLMDNYFVPQCIYKLIVDTFDIVGNKAELCEKFPANFIDHIIENSKYKDPINYNLFKDTPDNIDNFIDTFYGLNSAIVRCDIQESKRYFDIIDDMNIYHPYLEICRIRQGINEINATINSVEERSEKYPNELLLLHQQAEALYKDYPDDVSVIICVGDMAYIREDYEGAEKYYSMVTEIEPDNYMIKRRTGDICIKNGEFEKARDIYMGLLDINNYDDGARWGLTRANDGLIEKYSKEVLENPDNEDMKIDLVWCYYRNSMFKEAIDLLESFKPSEKKQYEYYNLLGRDYLYTKQHDKALESFNTWLDLINAIPDDDVSEDAKKHKARYWHANYYIGECYMAKEEYDEARKYLDIAVSEKHEFIDYAYEAICRLEYKRGRYEECVKVCENVIDSSLNFEGYMHMAKSFYQLEEPGHAIDCCEYAIRINPYFYEPYCVLLDIYWEYDKIDDVRAVIDRFGKLGYDTDKVEYYKARLLMIDGDNEGSNTIMKGLLEKKKAGEGIMEEDDYLNVYALIATNYERMDKEEDALKYLAEGLSIIPDDAYFINRMARVYHVIGDFEKECLYCDILLDVAKGKDYRIRGYEGKAAALSCMGKFEEACKVYETLEAEMGIDGDYVIDHAELLVRMNRLGESAKLLKTCINDLEYSSFVRGCIGNLCCFYGNEGYIKESYETFLLAIEKAPEDYNSYRSMGFVYLDHEMYKEAKEMFEKAMEIDTDNNSYTAGLYLQAVKKIDDISKPQYEKYIELAKKQVEDADTPYTYVKRAEVYRALGEYEEALAAADNAINYKRSKSTCFAESHDGWYEKGCIYREMGEYEKAVKCYKKAISIFGHHTQYEECLEKCKELLNKK